jgi:hypothetical protein
VNISEPNNLGQFTGQGVGNGQTDANSLQVNIYNWQSGKWEGFTFSAYTLALPDIQPYVDATGRLLVQLAVPTSTRQNINSGIPFITPQVQIQG